MALSPLDQIAPLLTEQFDMLIDQAHGTFNITIKNHKVIDIRLNKIAIRIVVIMKRKILNTSGRDRIAQNKVSRDKATVFIFPPNERVKRKILEYFILEISAPLFFRRSSSYFDKIQINGTTLI